MPATSSYLNLATRPLPAAVAAYLRDSPDDSAFWERRNVAISLGQAHGIPIRIVPKEDAAR